MDGITVNSKLIFNDDKLLVLFSLKNESESQIVFYRANYHRSNMLLTLVDLNSKSRIEEATVFDSVYSGQVVLEPGESHEFEVWITPRFPSILKKGELKLVLFWGLNIKDEISGRVYMFDDFEFFNFSSHDIKGTYMDPQQ